MKIKSWVVAGLVLAAGCGDDDAKAPDAQSTEALCQTICTRASKDCGGAEADCAKSCVDQAASTPAKCEAPLQAFLECSAKSDFKCDPTTGEADATSCTTQLSAFNDCYLSAFGVDSGTGTKDAASPGRSDAGTDTGTAPPAEDAGEESDAGADPTPEDASAPDSGPTCEVSPQASACAMCTGAKCCQQLADCVTVPSCMKLADCAIRCSGDNTCVQNCRVGASSSDINGLNALLSCHSASCSAECN